MTARPWFLLVVVVIVALLLLSAAASAAPAAVLQQGNMPPVSTETRLNHGNVNTDKFGYVFSRKVTGLVYAQVLYVPGVNVTTRDALNAELPLLAEQGLADDSAAPSSTSTPADESAGSTVSRNMIYVATMANYVYGFDADSPSAERPVWQRHIGNATYTPTRFYAIYMPADGICHPQVGVLGTPVIDQANNTMFLISWSLEDKTKYVFNFHALDIRTGENVRGTPTRLDVKWIDPDNPKNITRMDAKMQLQRPGLILRDGIVYAAFGAQCDITPYHGWIVGINATNGEIVRTWLANPHNGWSGIWMAGQSLTVDEDSGDLVVNVGNGVFDPASLSYGNAIVRIDPTDTDKYGQMHVKGFWAPKTWDELNKADADLGAAGVMLVPGTRLVVAGNKGWIFGQYYGPKIYVLDKDAMVNNKAADLYTISSEYPYGQGPLLQVVRVTDRIYGHVHGNPVHWKTPSGDDYVYVWPEADSVLQFQLHVNSSDGLGKFNATAFARGSEQLATFTMPGGFLQLSYDAGSPSSSAILWATHPVNGCDANQHICRGVLRAYDARNVGKELWNSIDDDAYLKGMSTPPPSSPANSSSSSSSSSEYNWMHAKFTVPTVANGRVYVPTFNKDSKVSPSCEVRVYALRTRQSPSNNGTSNIAENGATGASSRGTFGGVLLFGRLAGLLVACLAASAMATGRGTSTSAK